MVRRSTYSQASAASGAHRRSEDARQPRRSAGRPSVSSSRTSRPAHSAHAASSSAKILDFERLKPRSSAAAPASERPARASHAAHASRSARSSRPANGQRTRAQSRAAEEAQENPSFLAQMRRKLRHAKADRTFEGNVPAGESNASQDSAPHAGVYKGEMGRVQRRSSRMQEEGGKGSGSRLPFGFSLSGFKLSAPLRISGIVCACLILACAFVYPSARDCYVAIRTQDQVQAEYEAILERNVELQRNLDDLKTEEGMRNLAHSQYGYVSSGENAVKVTGLDATIDSAASDKTAAIASGSVAPPDTWYSPALDLLFGYSSGA